MSKKEKPSVNEIVKQIESLQSAIENLKEDMEQEKTYKFTRKQLVEFADMLYGNFKSYYSDEISGVGFSDEVVTFDLDGNTIVPSVDSDMIAGEIEEYASDPTPEQLENMVQEIIEELEMD